MPWRRTSARAIGGLVGEAFRRRGFTALDDILAGLMKFPGRRRGSMWGQERVLRTDRMWRKDADHAAG